jgi:hypothetical protein
VRDGKIILAEGAELPEGAIVTVTIGETEYLKSKVRASLNKRKPKKSSLPVMVTGLLEP